MSNEKKNIFIDLLTGAKITEIFRICDLICFSFELPDAKKMFLHLQCFLRIFDLSNELVICTQNLLNRSPNYRKKWYQRYDWTHVGATVFDDAIKEYKSQLLQTKILNIIFDYEDIKITLDNGMRIDILVSTTKYDDVNYSEDYRIFDEEENKDHYVIPPVKRLSN